MMPKISGVHFLWVGIFIGGLVLRTASAQSNEFPSGLVFASQPTAHFKFEGFTGRRIDAMVENWLLRAPGANPGMLEMFRVRDREPKPKLVPWAGEFVGKYLISAIQAQRLTANSELDRTVRKVVADLIACQAEDGYLGPFPKADRLRGNWDLWGHYHCMLALLMWHQAVGDAAALQCVRRAADLMCSTYLDSGRRPFEAGSDEMNLAVLHGLGVLYRVTREDRYRQLMRVIEQDWERGGDYFRKGLEGVEFFQTPRPRWESLHDLQGLVEIYRITGDARYRDSFEHHWRSIARWDLRNTGGFSSGEQATGNPYAPTPIETCCSIAWMCVSVDMLALTGDSRVADKLEMAALNAWAGAQHPSGRWCTYNTPMDGAREASAHTIVFQSRAGTPELNCCSVNGPRGWGMLAEWATMIAPDGIVQNWLEPSSTVLPLNNSKLQIRVEGNYPQESEVIVHIEPERVQEFTLKVRVPEWSYRTTATLNNKPLPDPQAGSYLSLRRRWSKSDRLRIKLDMGLRTVSGDKEARGKVSTYRGPLLLAWDQRFNEVDENRLPALDRTSLHNAQNLQSRASEGDFAPLILLDVPAAGGKLRLCDFASAGALGTRYRSWLLCTNALPPPSVARLPRDGATIPRGSVAFRWRGSALPYTSRQRLEISDSETFGGANVSRSEVLAQAALVPIDNRFKEDKWYYWRVVAKNQFGETPGFFPAARFKVSSTLPFADENLDKAGALGPGGELVVALLKGNPEPQVGKWLASKGWRGSRGRTGSENESIFLNGFGQKLLYSVDSWPESDFSLSLWFKVEQLPANRLGQIFSAWCAASDDPLRLVIDGGKLFARIEAGTGYSTKGVPVTPGQWRHAAVVKFGPSLSLYVDGEQKSTVEVPDYLTTTARDFAVGGNPHFTGDEHLGVHLSELRFYARALSPQEVSALSR